MKVFSTISAITLWEGVLRNESSRYAVNKLCLKTHNLAITLVTQIHFMGIITIGAGRAVAPPLFDGLIYKLNKQKNFVDFI